MRVKMQRLECASCHETQVPGLWADAHNDWHYVCSECDEYIAPAELEPEPDNVLRGWLYCKAKLLALTLAHWVFLWPEPDTLKYQRCKRCHRTFERDVCFTHEGAVYSCLFCGCRETYSI